MLEITMPIYKKDYLPRTRKDMVLGLNWLIQSSNVFKKKGNSTTALAEFKKIVYDIIEKNKPEILKQYPNWNPNHTENGFHVEYKVFVGRLGTDGHNVRSAMEKILLDALQHVGLIDDDKYVYTSASEFYLDRKNPRIEVKITHKDKYNYIIT